MTLHWLVARRGCLRYSQLLAQMRLCNRLQLDRPFADMTTWLFLVLILVLVLVEHAGHMRPDAAAEDGGQVAAFQHGDYAAATDRGGELDNLRGGEGLRRMEERSIELLDARKTGTPPHQTPRDTRRNSHAPRGLVCPCLVCPCQSHEGTITAPHTITMARTATDLESIPILTIHVHTFSVSQLKSSSSS